ncbi:unnamed protein product [Kuraishia capsulata CBS 1993]|uniref:Uncharacterized protein n=1 Tax=Kuraishia capsulata CBS 1993 TaxID=1382522 RepID=W6MWN5_9ASCO|nr:uncharacterized protein KUCA_T00003664001 [Kuraishia capsulata CBS 1993]CDK27685.1 unnamed protein product [Kuraishia capsulata CBS 1993]
MVLAYSTEMNCCDEGELITTFVKIGHHQSLSSRLRSLNINVSSLLDCPIQQDIPDLVSDSESQSCDEDSDQDYEMFSYGPAMQDRENLMILIVSIVSEQLYKTAKERFQSCACCQAVSVKSVSTFLQKLSSRLGCTFANFQRCLVIMSRLVQESQNDFNCLKKLILASFMINFHNEVEMKTWEKVTGLSAIALRGILSSSMYRTDLGVTHTELVELKENIRDAVMKRVKVI